MADPMERLERRMRSFSSPFAVEAEPDYLEQLNKEIEHYETRLKLSGEEVPPPKKEKNVLLYALDILDRPRNAIANAIQDVVDNENDFLQGFWEGLSGKERVYGGEFIERAGIKNPIARGALGFALDVAMDPLTYTGVPAAKALANAVGRSAGATAVKEGLSSLGNYLRVIPAGQKIADLIGPKFSNRYVRFSTTRSPEERAQIGMKKEHIHRSVRETYGEMVRAASDIWEKFKDIPEPALRLAPHVLEEPERAARRVAASGVEALEQYVRDIYGPEYSKVVSPLVEKYTREYASRVKGGPGKKALSAPDIEEVLAQLGSKKAARITKAAHAKALGQAARAGGMVDVFGAEDIARRAAEAGVPIEDVEKAATLLKESLLTSGMRDIAVGIKFEPIPNYVFHMYKDPPQKVKQALNEWRSAQMVKRAKMSQKGSFQYERSIPTLEEAKKLGLHPVENAAVIAAVREMEGIRARATKEMFTQLSKLGEPFVMNRADYNRALRAATEAGDSAEVQRLMQWKTVPSAHFPQDKLVHPEIAEALERAMGAFVTTGGAREFFDAWNKVQNVWKTAVTSLVPSFHIRNMFGNFYNNYLAGVTNPAHYAIAMRVLEGSDAPFRIGDLTMTGRQIYDEFIDQGLVGFGFFRGETQTGMREIAEDIMRGWQKPSGLVKGIAELPKEIAQTAREAKEAGKRASVALSPITGAAKFGVKYGRAIGDFMETWAKLAHYIAKRAQGLTTGDAAASVRKYLFDYGDITPLERTIRTFIPFYCLTDDAEALTRDGWKRYSDLSIGEEILTYNLDSGLTEWKPILDIFVGNYKGKMLRLKGKSLDVLCTPDHKWVTEVYGCRSGNRTELREAWKLRTNNKIITCAPHRDKADYAIPDDVLYLIGWIVTDGYIRIKKRENDFVECVIYQSSKKFADELRSVLQKYEYSEAPHPDTGVICFRLNGNLRKEIAKHIQKKQDVLKLISKLSNRQLEILFDAMYKAEGNTTVRSQPYFAQDDPVVRDAFQIICFLRNVIANETYRNGKPVGLYLRRLNNVVDCKNLDLAVEDYEGIVWCPHTENETWVAKVKGNPFVTGNTFTRKNIPLQLETLIKNPAKLARVIHMLDEAKQASGIDDTPEWIKEDLAVPIGTDDEGFHRYLRLDFPASQLAFLGTQGPREILNMLSPLAKVPFEVITGKTVSGRAITPYEGARGRYYLPIPGQKPGEPYQLPAWVDYAVQQTGALGREAMEALTGLAGLAVGKGYGAYSGGYAGEEPTLARRISDVMITREAAPPPEAVGKVPPTVRQLPFVGSFWYRYDPRRQAMLDAIRRRQQLQERLRYLKDVEGREVPTLRELGVE